MEPKRVPLKVPPGLYRTGTVAQSQGRWFSGHLVRFWENTRRPVGGWRPFLSSILMAPDEAHGGVAGVGSGDMGGGGAGAGAPFTAFPGVVRKIIAWRMSGENGNRRNAPAFALGSTKGLVLIRAGQHYDITPAEFVEGREDSEFDDSGSELVSGTPFWVDTFTEIAAPVPSVLPDHEGELGAVYSPVVNFDTPPTEPEVANGVLGAHFDSFGYYTPSGESTTNDMRVFITFSRNLSPGPVFGAITLFVRRTGADRNDWSGYAFDLFPQESHNGIDPPDDNSAIEITALVNGNPTSLGSVAIECPAGTSHTFEARVIGTSIKALYDGEVVLSITDASVAAGTGVALAFLDDTGDGVDANKLTITRAEGQTL